MNQPLLLRQIAWTGLIASPLLGALSGIPLWAQPASQLLPSMVHLVTLGFLVPLFFAHFLELNGPPVWHRLTAALPWLLSAGLAAFVVGMLGGNRWAFYLGGHYVAPMAIYLFALVAARTAWTKRRQGGLAGLGPVVLGLFVVANWGGMMVLDRFYGGKYAFFGPSVIAAHALIALLFFVLPWLYQARTGRTAPWPLWAAGGLALVGYLYGWLAAQPLYLDLAVMAAGVELVVFGQSFDQPARAARTLKIGWFLAGGGLVLASTGRGLSVTEPEGLLSFGIFLLFGLILPTSLQTQTILRPLQRSDWSILGSMLLAWCLALGWHWELPLAPLWGAYAGLVGFWAWPMARPQ